MGKDHSTNSFWSRLAQGALPKPSYAAVLPLDGNATASTTFSSTAEDQDSPMSQESNSDAPRIMPRTSYRTNSRATSGAPLASANPNQFRCTESQFGRYKSGRKVGDRLRSLNLPYTKNMIRSAIDKFQHKNGKTLKSRSLHRGLNWMQIRNKNKRLEKEEAGESGRSNFTAEQLGEIFRLSHNVPQVVMPGGKGKERAVDETNDGDTDNGDTDTEGDTDNGNSDTDVSGNIDDDDEDKENVAGPSTPRARNTTIVNTQASVTPPRTPGPSTPRTTVEDMEDEDEFKLPETPVPNRKLKHTAALFSASPEVSATPTKPKGLGKQASIPVALNDPFKVTYNIEPSQFLPTQPTTFTVPGGIVQTAFQEKPLPQFSGVNIQPTIRDQYVAEPPQTEIYNSDTQFAHQPQQTAGELHGSFLNAPQSRQPQSLPLDDITQSASQEAQRPWFSFPDHTNQSATTQQPQISSEMPSTAPIFQQPQFQFSFPAANNTLPQSTFQTQQQTLSSISTNSNFQQSAAQGNFSSNSSQNVGYQPQTAASQPAAFPAQTNNDFPVLSTISLNSIITCAPQNTRQTSWSLPIPAEDNTLKRSSLFGPNGVQAFVKEKEIPAFGSTPTNSSNIPVEFDDKSWVSKRRNAQRRTVFGPLDYKNLSKSPRTARSGYPPRGSEEDLIKRLAIEQKGEKKRGKKRVRFMLSGDEPARKKRRTDENSVPELGTSALSVSQSTSDQCSSELHAPKTPRSPVMPGAYDLQSEQRNEKNGGKKRVRFLLPDDEPERKKRRTDEDSIHTPETSTPSPDQCNLEFHSPQQETESDPVMPGAYELQSDDCVQVDKSVKRRHCPRFGEILLASFVWGQSGAWDLRRDGGVQDDSLV